MQNGQYNKNKDLCIIQVLVLFISKIKYFFFLQMAMLLVIFNWYEYNDDALCLNNEKLKPPEINRNFENRFTVGE